MSAPLPPGCRDIPLRKTLSSLPLRFASNVWANSKFEMIAKPLGVGSQTAEGSHVAWAGAAVRPIAAAAPHRARLPARRIFLAPLLKPDPSCTTLFRSIASPSDPHNRSGPPYSPAAPIEAPTES